MLTVITDESVVQSTFADAGALLLSGEVVQIAVATVERERRAATLKQGCYCRRISCATVCLS